MIKVDSVPGMLNLPTTKEIWAVTRREMVKLGLSLEALCRERFDKPPVYILNDESLRVYFIGVN